MQIDLHGYHPDEINVTDLVKQAWEMGATEVTLIHGHGHNRGLSCGFVNSNTGFFGLSIRREIRANSSELKTWAKVSSLDCSHDGSTTLKLKANQNPTRTELELPEPVMVRRRWG